MLKMKLISFLILVLALVHFGVVSSISLDKSGYYKLTVAIDDRTVQNDIANFTDNIRWGIQDLSDLLNHVTHGKFSIREADILVPSHWDVQVDGIATTQSYPSADIKISHTHELPYVNNPNSCGFPGDDILLPYNFFESVHYGPYGRLGKALLSQFARLRYGVWEEHGYPGDDKFPYFWKPLEKPNWEVNACTDQLMSGNYKTIDDETDCTPDPGPDEQIYPPSTTCRFFPDESQTAISSIMSYHYLKTFEEFCNSTNHNRKLPTPQNFYCKYKSVTEVIEGSPDWKYVTLSNDPDRVNIRVVQNPVSPLLYILLDAGISQAPGDILAQISSKLKNLVTSSQMRNIVATVGKFPSGDVLNPLVEVVPWSPLRSGTAEFETALDETFGTAAGIRNYAGALKIIVENLKKRNHKSGSVILVVKTGAEMNTGSLTPEYEVLTTVLESNLKIFAIELQASQIQPGFALESIASNSDGKHLKLATPDDLNVPFDEFMAELETTLLSSFKVDRNYVLAMKEILPKDVEIQLNFQGILKFEAFAIPLTGNIQVPWFRSVAGGNGNAMDTEFKPMADWGSSSTANSIFYASGEFWQFPEDNMIWDLFEYTCTGNCEVLVVIMSRLQNLDGIPTDIKLTVSTSAVNNVVDLAISNAGTDVGSAFAIYAKLDQDSVPLTPIPGLEISALVYLQDRSRVWKVPLIDDGRAIPDISHNDGIYSAAFIPPDNGIYKIIVIVKYRVPPLPAPVTSTTPTSFLSDDNNFRYLLPSRSQGKLFPVDQDKLGCGSGHLGCWTKVPDVEFVAGQDLSEPIEFINVYQFIPLTNRITDFRATPIGENKILFEWTSPAILRPEGIAPGWAYEMKTSDNFDLLLNEFTTAEPVPMRSNNPMPVGSLETLEHDFGREAKQYFGIWTISEFAQHATPVISVIVGVNIISGEVVSTTTTTTTTVRPTTVSTTMRPTTTFDPTNTATTEDDGPTTSTTPRISSPRTTRPTTTTPAPTTPKPTTKAPATTTEEPDKHWFREKEGIITLSVFGAAVILLAVGSGILLYFIKFRRG